MPERVAEDGHAAHGRALLGTAIHGGAGLHDASGERIDVVDGEMQADAGATVGVGRCHAGGFELVRHHPPCSGYGQLAVPHVPVRHHDRVEGHLGAENVDVPLDGATAICHTEVGSEF